MHRHPDVTNEEEKDRILIKSIIPEILINCQAGGINNLQYIIIKYHNPKEYWIVFLSFTSGIEQCRTRFPIYPPTYPKANYLL